MWFEILKNIQISSQKTSSRDYVRPDEDDTTCRERFENMLNFIDNVWDSSVEELDVDWPDEIFCKALEYINKHTFLLYNPYGDEDFKGNKKDLFKYTDAFEFYADDNFEADIIHNIGNNHALKLTYRMVFTDINMVNIFCYIQLGEINGLDHVVIQIFENFSTSDVDNFNLLNEDPYDDGVVTISIPKDKEPTYLKRNDWRKF